MGDTVTVISGKRFLSSSRVGYSGSTSGWTFLTSDVVREPAKHAHAAKLLLTLRGL